MLVVQSQMLWLLLVQNIRHRQAKPINNKTLRLKQYLGF